MVIEEWEKKGCINNKTSKSLKMTNSIPARCYALSKIHKPNIPLRLIVSTNGCPSYTLGSYLSSIISKGITPPISRARKNFEFIKKIRNIQISLNHVLFSLDATSLFTNVQIGLVHKGHKVIKTRFSQIKSNTRISLSEFLIGIRVCTSNSSFNFKGVSYKQKSGFSMGSPLSPIISDIFMDDLERECLSKLTFKLPFYFRYVDVIITAAPPDKIDTILNAFNNYNNKPNHVIKFS